MTTNSHTSTQSNSLTETDAQETQEWLDALAAVIETEGTERAHFLIEAMIDQARRSGSNLPYNATTAYVNTCLLYTSKFDIPAGVIKYL